MPQSCKILKKIVLTKIDLSWQGPWIMSVFEAESITMCRKAAMWRVVGLNFTLVVLFLPSLTTFRGLWIPRGSGNPQNGYYMTTYGHYETSIFNFSIKSCPSTIFEDQRKPVCWPPKLNWGKKSLKFKILKNAPFILKMNDILGLSIPSRTSEKHFIPRTSQIPIQCPAWTVCVLKRFVHDQGYCILKTPKNSSFVGIHA